MPHKGYKKTDEEKTKHSIAMKKLYSENKIVNGMKGKKPWNFGLKLSDEYCKKLSDAHKGKRLPVKQKQKISISLKKAYSDGRKKVKKETVEAFKKAAKNRKGKTYEEIYGNEKAKQIKKQQSIRIAGSLHPMYNKNHTAEARTKMSNAKKGKKPWNYGLTAETDNRVKKCSQIRAGQKRSIFARKKMSESQKILRRNGYVSSWKGKHHTEESKERMSTSHKGKKMPLGQREKISNALAKEKCYLWKGGKSFEPYGIEFDKQLKQAIRFRDSYRCQECFRHESELFTKKGKPRKLIIHHIDYNKKNNNSENLISLCLNCHSQTNFDREDWIKYFKIKILDEHSIKQAGSDPSGLQQSSASGAQELS